MTTSTMTTTTSTASYGWVISKWKDSLFLIGGCSISFLLLLADQFVRWWYPRLYHHVPTITFWVWSYLIDAPHIYGSLMRTYADKQEWQTRPKTLLFGMLWYLLGGSVTILSFYMNKFWPQISYNVLLAFWSYWHVTRQHYGMLVIYKYKNNDHAKWDNILDSMMLYVGLLLPYITFILYSRLLRIMFGLSRENGPWIRMTSQVLWTLYIAMVVVYIGRQVYIYMNARETDDDGKSHFSSKVPRLNVPKLLFMLACLSVSLAVLNPWISGYFNFISVIPIIVAFHDVQYHALLDFYSKNRYHSPGRDASWFGPASFLSKFFVLYYLGGILIAYSFRVITCSSGPWGYRPSYCDTNPFWDRRYVPVVGSGRSMEWLHFVRHFIDGIVSSAAIHHYWLDSIIWKTRSNQDLLKNLNVESIKQVGKLHTDQITGLTHETALTPVEYTPLQLKEKFSIGPNVFVYRFSLPSSNHHTGLIDGQYVAVRAQLIGKKVEERFYSPVSSGNQYGVLDLMIKQDPQQQGLQGSMATYIDQLKVGCDNLEFCGPVGGFDEDVTMFDHVAFICKGTGIAPCIQILRGIFQQVQKPITLTTKFSMIYSNVNQEEILFREEIEQYAEQYPDHFKLYHILSEESDESTWLSTVTPSSLNHAVGYINQQQIHRAISFPNSPRNKVIVCCPPVMCKPVLTMLSQAGFNDNCIFNYI